MPARPPTARRAVPVVERCEPRSLAALVFVFNGNGFNAAGPDRLTADAAATLRRTGERVVEVSYGRVNTAAAFDALAASVRRQAHGQSVGLVGFSAGGAIALRLAATPGLSVSAVLDYYGVPDVAALLGRHTSVRPVAGLSPFRPTAVARFSGPVATTAHVVGAFGQFDPNVQAGPSTADLRADAPGADVFVYPGGHGVGIHASPAALSDFLAHVG